MVTATSHDHLATVQPQQQAQQQQQQSQQHSHLMHHVPSPMTNIQHSPQNQQQRRPYSASSSSCGSSDASDTHLSSPLNVNHVIEAPRSISNNFPVYPHTPQHHQHQLMESPPSVASIDASAAMFPSCGFNNFLSGYATPATPSNPVIPGHHEQAYTSPHHHAIHENVRHHHHHHLHVDSGVEHIDIPLYANTQQYSPNSVQPHHQFVH
jgi:hypothetical protein